MKIELTLKEGSGKAAFFADIDIDNGIKIFGCPVWNGKPGHYKLSMPSKQGNQGKWFPVLQLSREIMDTLEAAVIREIEKSLHEQNEQNH